MSAAHAALRTARVLGAVLLAAGAADVAAADSLYQVEVIVFEYNTPVAVDGEQWPEDGSMPATSDAIDLMNDAAVFHALPPEEMRLSGAWQRLRSAPNTHPILHVGWRQPALWGANARAVRITSGTPLDAAPEHSMTEVVPIPQPVDRVRGSVRVKIGRSMNVDVDLGYAYQGQVVRLKESRKMKLGELHYFDHPLFGALVQVVALRDVAETPAGEPEEPPIERPDEVPAGAPPRPTDERAAPETEPPSSD